MSRAGQALQALKAAERQKIGYLFRNAHAIVKHSRPLRDFAWIATLDKAKGLETSFALQIVTQLIHFTNYVSKCSV